MKPTFDPIKFEVIRNALVEATEEMTIALRRSAYSTNIKTRADFSCAFFDRELQPVAQSFTQPVHLGSLSQSVPRVIREYGPENLGPGDAILSNDPYLGGVHLNDITLISPVYYNDELFGYVANLAHHVDVGGGAPASIGAFREVFQEGVIISAVKMVEGGEIDSDVFRLVLAQIRSKHETAGDFRAQVASNNTGVRRLIALLDRIGPEMVAFYIDQLLAYTERRTRAEIAKLPQGVFSADGYVDNDGYTDEPVRLVGKMVMDDHGVLFDLNGSEPQRRAPVNSTYAQTFSACAYVLKSLIDPDIPVNAGFYRLVQIDAPLGTVVNCTPPAPVVGGWETQVRLTDVLLKALSPAIPDRIPAGTKAMMCQMGFGALLRVRTNSTPITRRWLEVTVAGSLATDLMQCSVTGRIPRTLQLRRRRLTIPCTLTATNWWMIRTVRANIAVGSGCGATTSLTMRSRSPSSQIGIDGDLGGCSAETMVRLRATH